MKPWKKKFLHELTNRVLLAWEEKVQKKEDPSIVTVDIIDKEEVSRFKNLMNKDYINFRTIEFPKLISSKGFYNIIDQDGKVSYGEDEFFISYNWKDREKAQKSTKFRICINSKEKNKDWFLSEKGEALARKEGWWGVFVYKIEHEAYYKFFLWICVSIGSIVAVVSLAIQAIQIILAKK